MSSHHSMLHCLAVSHYTTCPSLCPQIRSRRTSTASIHASEMRCVHTCRSRHTRMRFATPHTHTHTIKHKGRPIPRLRAAPLPLWYDSLGIPWSGHAMVWACHGLGMPWSGHVWSEGCAHCRVSWDHSAGALRLPGRPPVPRRVDQGAGKTALSAPPSGSRRRQGST